MSRSWNANTSGGGGSSQVGADLPSDYKPIISSQILRRGASKPSLLKGSNDSIPCLLTEDTLWKSRGSPRFFALGHDPSTRVSVAILLDLFSLKSSTDDRAYSIVNKMFFLFFEIYIYIFMCSMIFELLYVSFFVSRVTKLLSLVIRVSFKGQFNLFILVSFPLGDSFQLN